MTRISFVIPTGVIQMTRISFVIPTGVIQMTERRNLIDPSTSLGMTIPSAEPVMSNVEWLGLPAGRQGRQG